MIDQAVPHYSDLRIQRLLELIIELREKESLAELKDLLEKGVDPMELQDCFMEGMHRIGIQFETGVYFIAALIMAGEIMRSAMELLSPYLKTRQNKQTGGRIIIGTIQGDIHDLGKNLFSFLLKCHGFEVIDLGVDIPANKFLEQIKTLKPDIVGISCVLTTNIEKLKQAVDFLQKKMPGSKLPIIIGGTCIDEHMARHIGSVIWAKDAASGLKICQSFSPQNSQSK